MATTKRMVGLDVFRIFSALLIFCFHSNIHINCTYWIFTPFVSMGAVVMTGFFLLSGFTLYYTWGNRDLMDINEAAVFYAKRFISIIPAYYFIAFVHGMLNRTDTLQDLMILLPIELLGIQSTFDSLFSVSHNSGTWFVSCIILCYLIFPLIQRYTKQSTLKTKWLIIAVCAAVLLYSPFVEWHFRLSSIYSNPFFRILEFIIGVELCGILNDGESTAKNTRRIKSKVLCSWPAWAVELAVLIIGITLAVKLNIAVRNYMLYSWIGLPIFSLMLITLSNVRADILVNSKLIKYLSKISYTFFLAQFFCFKITKVITSALHCDTNLLKIIISLLCCLIIAIIVHEMIEKPISKLFNKKVHG